ncbi:MAG: hypothetical protein ACHQQQ_00015 [Bacteroidota bacterium]
MEEFKGYLTQMIFRWLLKIIGGYFAIDGIVNAGTKDALLEISTGISAVIIGIVISMLNHKKVYRMEPDK